MEEMMAGAKPKRDIVSHGEYQGVIAAARSTLPKKLFAVMGIARDDKPMRQDWVLRGFRQIRRAGLAGAELRPHPRSRRGLSFRSRRALLRHRAGGVGSRLGSVINGQGITRSDIVREVAGIPEDQVIMTCVAMDIRRQFSGHTVRSDREANGDFVHYVGFAD